MTFEPWFVILVMILLAGVGFWCLTCDSPKSPKPGWGGVVWGRDDYVVGSPYFRKHNPKDDCPECCGDGWDADWGGPYICPACQGTGVRTGKEEVDGNGLQ